MRAQISAVVTTVALALPLHLHAQDRPAAAETQGAAVYAAHCASCHDQVGARIPTRDALAQMSPARILRTLDFGLMMSIAYPLQRGEREAVAAFLGKGRDDTAPPASALCAPDKRIMAGASQASWTGWGPARTTRAFRRPSARACARPTSHGSSSNGRTASPATSSRSRRRRSSTARCSSAAPAAPCRRSTRRPAACTGFTRRTGPCAPQ